MYFFLFFSLLFYSVYNNLKYEKKSKRYCNVFKPYITKIWYM